MDHLVVGSGDARCLPSGIAPVGHIHAVDPTSYTTLCTKPVVFVFLEVAFPITDSDTSCPTCAGLAAATGRQLAHAA